VTVLFHRLFVFPRARIENTDGPDGSARTTLRVEGLLCSLCAARVQAALESVPGVRHAQVDLNSGTATVDHERAKAPPPVLAWAVDSAVLLRPLRRLLATMGGLRRRPSQHQSDVRRRLKGGED